MVRIRHVGSAAYVLSTVAAGTAVLGQELLRSRLSGIAGPYPQITVTLAVLLLATELRPDAWLIRHEGGDVTGSWTFAYALLLVAGPVAAMPAMATASLAADLTHRKPLDKSAFNAAQFVLCLEAGHLVLQAGGVTSAVTRATPLHPQWVLVVSAAAAVIFLMNGVVVSTAIALAQDRSVWQTIRSTIFLNLTTDGMLLALGPAFVLVAERSLLLVGLLLIVTLTVYQSAYTALAREYEAGHDALTGLLNRRRFEKVAAEAIELAGRRGRKLGVVLIDLDGFKVINDQFGHHIGDLVLAEVATRLESDLVEKPHLSARLGGDEFAVVVSSVEDATAAMELARSVLARLSGSYTVQGFPVSVEASMGVAVYPDDGNTLPVLLRHADVAMYWAKSEGDNVKAYSSAGSSKGDENSRLGLLADLTAALERAELQIHYQPKASTDGTFVGVEALLRWHHPTLGIVPPDHFIRMAEHTELIHKITAYVIDGSLTQLASWRAEGLPTGFTMAVNVSARNLVDRAFPRLLQRLASQTGVDPSALELEVTENAFIRDRGKGDGTIHTLASMGVRLVLDDFGTGFSSMANLRQLPVAALKIDKSFVQQVGVSYADRTIVATLVQMAHRLGLEVTAEGIEDQGMLETVAAMGCDYLQGYLLSRPLPAEELTPLLLQKCRQAEVASAS